MENSFFEYRDVAESDSDSDEEFIDNSIIEESSSVKKKNHTLFVAESEESTDDESNDCSMNKEDISQNVSKKVVRQSGISDEYVVPSSDDETSRRGSIRKQSVSSSKVVLSSSEEDDKAEQYSPEIVPRRKHIKKKSPEANDSIIVHKTRKRIMLIDSDTDNSIVIEHNNHRKVKCMQDTPIKIDSKKNIDNNVYDDNTFSEISIIDDEIDRNDSTVEYDVEKSMSERKSNTKSHSIAKNSKQTDIKRNSAEDNDRPDHDDSDHDSTDHKNSDVDHDRSDHNDSDVDHDKSDHNESDHDKSDCDGSEHEVINASSEDEGPDEDQLVMSRATRMSIMGVIPKDDHNDSDDSDFIQSDESSKRSSTSSLSDLPEVSMTKSPEKTHLSPKYDVTSKPKIDRKSITTKIEPEQDQCIIVGESENFKESIKQIKKNNYEDDVTIIETEPVIIALSSDDDDDDVLETEKSPKTKKSIDAKKKSPNLRKSLNDKKSPQLQPSVDVKKKSPKMESIKQYLTPASYPNHEIRFVKKHERETELKKLVALQDELKTTNYILEEMDLNSLPDGGSKVIERLTHLEMQVQLQGSKVANMVVEPENPTAADIARDGFNNEDGLSWDDIQKASNAVQPRMFGKQAMSTHMAERNLILDRLRDLYESLASRPADSQKAKQPHGVATSLLPHQLHALAWLRWRETQRPRAGILADDMGLGKTITMLALIVSDKEGAIDDEDDDDDDYRAKSKTVTRGGTLVVCPASLMQQWGGEVTKHCKPYTLSVCLHHGPARATQPNRLATHDLVCTTYNILQRDNEKNGVLMRVAWRRVILDEAHIVRNYKSATCAAVCSLRARRRWCLTGTPVQNKDLDLFALIKFLRCSPFDDLPMWKKWIDNKSQGGQERMNTMMQCLLLRRTKVQLQQKGQLDCLPDRETHHRQVTLSKAEMNVYQKVLVFSKTLFAQFLHQRAEKNADIHGFSTSSTNKNTEYDKMHKKMIALQGAKPVKSHEILVLLLRLRQVCCHCGLIAAMLDEDSAADVQEDPAGQDLLAELNKLSLEESRSKRKSNNNADSDEENHDPAQEGTTVTEAIRSVLSPNNPVFQLSRLSSKISAVMDCLKNDVFVHKDDKAVVVSQWTSVLKLVESELKKSNIRCVTLSGNVPVNARPPLIDAINDANNDVKVMLLSLCAGGVGLNLCGANHLLLLDPHWNPQLEEQAQDRIYRVGQKKNVNIYRFMCVDTVEQSIRKLQEAKLEMAENVLTGAKNTNKSKLTIEDLKILFNMGQ